MLIQAIKKKYYAEYLEDKAYLLNVYDDFKKWHISFDTYMPKFSVKQFLLLLFRIIKGFIIKIAFWWPFSIVTYIWNRVIIYSFIPLQQTLYYFADKNGNTPKWKKSVLYFDYFLLFLSTFGGLTLLFAKLLHFWHITRWEYIGKYERYELREDDIVQLINSWLDKLAPIGRARRKTKRFIIDKLILNPWYLAKRWLNPKKYWVFRLFYFKKGRKLIYNLYYVYITFPIWAYYRMGIVNIKYKSLMFRRIRRQRYYRNFCFILKYIRLRLNPELIWAMTRWRFWKSIYLVLKACSYLRHWLTVFCLVVGQPFVEIYIWVVYFVFLRRTVQIGYFEFRNLWYYTKFFFSQENRKKKKDKKQKQIENEAKEEDEQFGEDLRDLEELITRLKKLEARKEQLAKEEAAEEEAAKEEAAKEEAAKKEAAKKEAAKEEAAKKEAAKAKK